MRFLLTAITLCFMTSQPVWSQKRISKEDLKMIRLMDDSLQEYGDKMLDAAFVTDRLRADSMFTRLLVRAMRIPGSFYVPFDSVQVAPVLYPDDSSFRIITWHIPMNEENFRQKGVIQYATEDGSLQLTPLFDFSDYTDAPTDSVRYAANWIGAVYYKIIQCSAGDKKIYTLLGYDENNDITTRKWIETLTFNAQKQPVFGGDFFDVKNDSIFPKGSKRFVLEYKKEGRARINYDEVDSLIIVDNLVSESNEPEKKFTLIPGGDYEAFKWENGRWRFIEKLFMEQREDGNEPRPMTIFDDKGNIDEAALDRQTLENLKKAEKEKSAPGSTPKNNTQAPAKKTAPAPPKKSNLP